MLAEHKENIYPGSSQGKGMTFSYDAARAPQPEKDFLLDKDTLLARANAGDPHAQLLAGFGHSLGTLGFPVNISEAARFIELACSKGVNSSPAAICAKGFLAEGMEENIQKFHPKLSNIDFAMQCYTEAEAHGYFPAVYLQTALSRELSPLDKRENIIARLRYCVDQGFVPAMYTLALCLSDNTPQFNEEEAYKWFCNAAERGDGPARFYLAQAFEGVPTNLKLAQNKEQAISLYRLLEAQNWPDVDKNLLKLGCQPMPAIAVPVASAPPMRSPVEITYSDYDLELECLSNPQALMKAAELGRVSAMFLLGFAYSEGRFGFNENRALATKWVNEAANKNRRDCPAKACAEAYLIAPNNPHAASLKYKQSFETGADGVDRGYVPGQYLMLNLYYTQVCAEERSNNGIPQQEKREQIVKRVELLIEKGFVPAKGFLAQCYYEGFGVQQNHYFAKQLLNEAIAQGDDPARKFMNKYYPTAPTSNGAVLHAPSDDEERKKKCCIM